MAIDFSDLGAKPIEASNYFDLGATLVKPAVKQESVEEFESRGGNIATKNEFARGVARGGAQMAGSAIDFLRVFSDSPKLKEIADELNQTAEAIPTKAGSVMDVVRNPSLAPAYVARVTGELAPQAVAAYLSGGSAAALGRGAGLGEKGLRIASGLGAAVTSIPQEVGDIARETEDRTGKIDSAGSLLYGVPSGMLDAVSAERILGKVFNVTEKEAQRRAWRQIVRDTVKELPKAAGVEGGTESAQEVLHIFADKSADKTFDLLTKENGLRVLESAVAGTIGGLFMGGGTEVGALGLQKAERNKAAKRLREDHGLRSRLSEFLREREAGQEAAPAATPAPAETPAMAGKSSSVSDNQQVANTQTDKNVEKLDTPNSSEPVMAASDVTGFTTSRGSEYTFNELGQTERLKKSPGKGQGQLHEALPVVFLPNADASESVLNAANSNGRITLAEQGDDGEWRQIRPDATTDLRGRKLAVYVHDRSNGNVITSGIVSTEPSVGAVPLELGYKGDIKTYHIGHPITQLKSVASGQAAPTPTQPNQRQVGVEWLGDPDAGINDSAKPSAHSPLDIAIGQALLGRKIGGGGEVKIEPWMDQSSEGEILARNAQKWLRKGIGNKGPIWMSQPEWVMGNLQSSIAAFEKERDDLAARGLPTEGMEFLIQRDKDELAYLQAYVERKRKAAPATQRAAITPNTTDTTVVNPDGTTPIDTTIRRAQNERDLSGAIEQVRQEIQERNRPKLPLDQQQPGSDFDRIYGLRIWTGYDDKYKSKVIDEFNKGYIWSEGDWRPAKQVDAENARGRNEFDQKRVELFERALTDAGLYKNGKWLIGEDGGREIDKVISRLPMDVNSGYTIASDRSAATAFNVVTDAKNKAYRSGKYAEAVQRQADKADPVSKVATPATVAPAAAQAAPVDKSASKKPRSAKDVAAHISKALGIDAIVFKPSGGRGEGVSYVEIMDKADHTRSFILPGDFKRMTLGELAAMMPAKTEAKPTAAPVEAKKPDVQQNELFVPAINVGTRSLTTAQLAQLSPVLPGESTFVDKEGKPAPSDVVIQVRYRTSGSGAGLRVYAGDKPIYKLNIEGRKTEQDGHKGVAIDMAQLMDLSKWELVPKAPYVLPRDVKVKKIGAERSTTEADHITDQKQLDAEGNPKTLAETNKRVVSDVTAEQMGEVVKADNGDPVAHMDALIMFLEDNPDLIADLKSGDQARKAKVDAAVAKWLVNSTLRRAGKRVITSEMRAELESRAMEQAKDDLLELAESGDILSLIHSRIWRPDGNVTDTKVATGAEQIREMLPEAGLNAEQLRIANFLLDNIPAKYLNQMTLRIRTVLKNGQQAYAADGSFNAALNIVDVARNSTNAKVMAHEVSHYLSQFLTSGYRLKNYAAWQQAVDTFVASSSWMPRSMANSLRAGVTSGEFRDMLVRVATDQGSDVAELLLKNYYLSNPDEFFARRFTDVINERSQEVSWVAEILRHIIDAVKRLFGKQTLYEQAWNELRTGRISPDLKSGLLFDANMRGQGMVASLASLNTIEDVQKLVNNIPDADAAQFYRDAASAINRSLIPPSIESLFNRLAAAEGDIYRDALEHLNKSIYGALPTIQSDTTLRDLLESNNYTQEQKAHVALMAFENWIKFNSEAANLRSRLEETKTELEEANLKAIEEIPERNDAEYLAARLLASIIDKIHAEQVDKAVKADEIARNAMATESLQQLKAMTRSTTAMSRALTGMGRLIPRETLRNPAQGAQVLEELSAAIDMSVSGITNHSQWIKRLASELHKFEVGDKKMVNASSDAIESALHLLYQFGNANEALLMMQLAEDGTVKKFDEEFLEKLKSKSPVGYTTLLKKYAKAQVESDALLRASKILNSKVDRLQQKVSDMTTAVELLDMLQKDPGYIAHGKLVQAINEAQYLDYEREELKGGGYVMRYKDPITGERVDVQHGLSGEMERENIQKLAKLAENGFAYAAKPDADPFRAAYWTEFGNRVLNTYLRPDLNPASPFKVPAFLDPVKLLERWRFSIIADYEFSKLPGIQAAVAHRTLQAFAQAKKLGTEVVQSYAARIEQANRKAVISHRGMTVEQWYNEVMLPIHDSRQTHGQAELKAGDYTHYGHIVTQEDMSAIALQAAFDHSMRRTAEKAMNMVAAGETAVRVRVADNLRRLSKSRGPGTVSRRTSMDRARVARDWFRASVAQNYIDGWVKAHPDEEFNYNDPAYRKVIDPQIDSFLSADKNFERIILAHVLESDPAYIFFGKGKLRKSYNALAVEAQELFQNGTMPGNLNELSEWMADHHNNLKENERNQLSEGEVRSEIIKEVSAYMKRIQDDSVEPPNQKLADLVLRENSFTTERGQKIAPGTFYEYGTLNFQGMAAKLNEATVWYLLQHREEANAVMAALREEKDRLRQQLSEVYGGTGPVAQLKQRHAIQKQRRTGDAQLTLGEVEESIRRVGKHINNIEDMLNRRNEFFGNDVADRMTMPWSNVLVGGLLTANPRATITNLAGGMVMRIMNVSRISPYGTMGWVPAPFRILTSVFVESANGFIRNLASKGYKENMIAKYARANPAMIKGIAESMIYDQTERLRIDEAMHESGIKDDVSVWMEMKNVWGSLFKDLSSNETGFKEQASAWLTAMPRSIQIIYRKLGPRVFDNLINASVFTDVVKLERDQAKRALKTFNARFENDPAFKAAYDAAGNDFDKFALAWRQRGVQLTPYELLGGVNNELFRTLLNTDKSALHLRELFRTNTDIELVMLRYWWNQKHGNTNASFFHDGERLSLLFQMAQDTNMGTSANNPLYFQGSRTRQKFGLLLNYPMRAAARIADIYSRTSKQRFSVWAWPAFVLFTMIAGLVGIVGNDISDDLNKLAFGTTSNKPTFANATTDSERAMIFLAAASQHMGMIGSVYNLLNDTARKNGFQNPILMVNVLQDMAKTGVKMYQTGDLVTPAVDFAARYQAPVRIALNIAGVRSGLNDQREAVNLLTAAAPDSMEALKRQPGGGDMRSTPLTPVYASIINAAQQGNWQAAKELFAKAVQMKMAEGMDEAHAAQAVQTSLQMRKPESSVFRKQLTDAERQLVYSRLSPEQKAKIEQVNAAFDVLKTLGGGSTGSGHGGSSGSKVMARSSTFGKTSNGRSSLRSRFGSGRRSLRSSLRSSSRKSGRRDSLRSRLRR